LRAIDVTDSNLPPFEKIMKLGRRYNLTITILMSKNFVITCIYLSLTISYQMVIDIFNMKAL